MRVRLFLLLSGFVLYCLFARSATVLLSPVADTTLFQLAPDNNLGGYVTLAAGTTAHGDKSRALLKFDVSSVIPPGARILAVRVRLRVVRAPGSGGQPSQFTLHRVLVSWSEGDKAQFATGSPGSEGETTWNNRAHGSVPWQNPGAQPGADFISTATMSSLISSTGIYTFASSDAAVADVQAWLERPIGNHGWILMSQSEATWETARRIGSREDPSNQPILEVDYSPVSISRVERRPGVLDIVFPVAPGYRYTVEARSTLTNTPWSVLTNFNNVLQPSEAIASDSTQDSSQRFYRVGRESL